MEMNKQMFKSQKTHQFQMNFKFYWYLPNGYANKAYVKSQGDMKGKKEKNAN